MTLAGSHWVDTRSQNFQQYLAHRRWVQGGLASLIDP